MALLAELPNQITISSCQSATTFETVNHCWSHVRFVFAELWNPRPLAFYVYGWNSGNSCVLPTENGDVERPRLGTVTVSTFIDRCPTLYCVWTVRQGNVGTVRLELRLQTSIHIPRVDGAADVAVVRTVDRDSWLSVHYYVAFVTRLPVQRVQTYVWTN